MVWSNSHNTFKIPKSEIMFGTSTFILVVEALNAFKGIVMCSCYMEFKYLTK